MTELDVCSDARDAMIEAVDWSNRLVARTDFLQWLDHVLVGGVVTATALVPPDDAPVLTLPAYLEQGRNVSTPCLVVTLRSRGLILAWAGGSLLDRTYFAARVDAETIIGLRRKGRMNSDEETLTVRTPLHAWKLTFLLLATPGRRPGAVDAVARTVAAAAGVREPVG